MESYQMAVECYKKALSLDPENEGYKKNLKLAQDKATVSYILYKIHDVKISI